MRPDAGGQERTTGADRKSCTQCGKEESKNLCDFRHIRRIGVVPLFPTCRMSQQRRKVEEDRMTNQQDLFEPDQNIVDNAWVSDWKTLEGKVRADQSRTGASRPKSWNGQSYGIRSLTTRTSPSFNGSPALRPILSPTRWIGISVPSAAIS